MSLKRELSVKHMEELKVSKILLIAEYESEGWLPKKHHSVCY